MIFELAGELRDARALDVGCGDGALVCAATARGAVVTGVEPDPDWGRPDPAILDAARMRAGHADVKAAFLDGRIERLPFPDAGFDIVAAITVLCIVADASVAMR